MTFSTLGTDTTTFAPVTINKTVRPQGLYIVGRQGTGKSGLLEYLIYQDIKQGLGVCVLDPHHNGGIIDNIIARLPASREKDVIFLDLRDYLFPFGLNSFTCADPSNPVLVQETGDRVLHVFDKLLGVSPDVRLIRQYLRHSAYTLIANPGYTMVEIPRLLRNKEFRQKLIAQSSLVLGSEVAEFWQDYEDMPANEQREKREPAIRRLEELLQPLTRNIVGQSVSTLDLRAIMDDQKILLVKLDSLALGNTTDLIGSLFLAAFLTAAPTRTKKQNLFNIYADEFQNFATEDFVKLIEEARKFGIGITIAHQNRAQLELSDKKAEAKLKERVLNVGSLIVFCVPTDAQELAPQFDYTPTPSTETRREAVLAINPDPVGWFKQGHGHPSKQVLAFVTKYIKPIVQDHDYMDYYLRPLNDFLVNAMEGEQLATSAKQQTILHTLIELILTKSVLNDCLFPTSDPEEHLRNMFFVERFSENFIRGIFGEPLQREYPILTDLKQAVEVFLHSYQGSGTFLPGAVKTLADVLFSYFMKYLFEFDWTKADKSTDQEKLFYHKLTTWNTYQYVYKHISYWESSWKVEQDRKRRGYVVPGFETLRPLEPEEHEVRVECSKLRYIYKDGLKETSPVMLRRKDEAMRFATQNVDRLQMLITDWDEVGRLLNADPLKKETGLYEEKPVPRTYADRQNEIANELTRIPAFIAHVRIVGDTEHIIQTIDPDEKDEKDPKKLKRPKLYGQPLQDRIARIQTQNRIANPYGYTRSRQDVEEEIKLRQSARPEKPKPLERRFPVGHEPEKPIAAGESQLEQALAALTPARHKEELRKGLTTLEIFEEWREQEAQKLFTAWLNKRKDAQQ